MVVFWFINGRNKMISFALLPMFSFEGGLHCSYVSHFLFFIVVIIFN